MEWFGSLIIGILLLSLAFQIIWCASLSVIASKSGESDLMQVLAWIPILQMIPMIVVGGGSVGRFVLGTIGLFVGSVALGMASTVLGSGAGIGGFCLVVLLCLFYFARLFWNTAIERDLPGWIGLLLFIPVVNFLVYPYIAFHDGWELPHKVGLALGLVITLASFAPSYQSIREINENGGFPTDAEGWTAFAEGPELAAIASQLADRNELNSTDRFRLGKSSDENFLSREQSATGAPHPSDKSIGALFALQESFDALERATEGQQLQDPNKRAAAMGILQSALAELEANQAALGSETYSELATHLREIELSLSNSSRDSSFTTARRHRPAGSSHESTSHPAAIAHSAVPLPSRPLPVQATGDCAGATELRTQNRDGHEEEWCEQNAAAGGLRHGWYAKYLESGKPISIGEYRDGLRVGTWTRFYPSGSVRMQAEFAEGLQHGWLLSFDESGERTQAVLFSEGTALR